MNRRNTFFQLMKNKRTINHPIQNAQNTINLISSHSSSLQYSLSIINHRKKTFDASKLTKLISLNTPTQSFYERKNDSKYKKKINNKNIDHFFIDWGQSKNTSKIGFTSINPLITNSKITTNIFQIPPIKKKFKQSRLNKTQQHQSNKQKPYTLQKNNVSSIMYDKIKKQYPHGILGIDHPENKSGNSIYEAYQNNFKVRNPPKNDQIYQLSPKWKTKKMFPQQRYNQFVKKNCGLGKRVFRKQNMVYDIISNRITTDQS